ncbi:MAG TPA: hypothetical protein VFA43_22435 [Gemmatimonadaceae bacterium]|nr:hypothetical protein [Gemmatimonadaceae bacterium]
MSCGGGSSSPTSPQTGTVSGAVTSGSVGVSGASVTVTPAGQSALAAVTTSASGGYSVSSVPVGSGTVAVSNLPSGCNASGGSYSGLAANGTATVNVAVTCAAAQTGSVSGTVTNSSTHAGIGGATIIVTPTGKSALTSVSTSSSGAYTVSNVPLGGGAVAVSHLPNGCTTPAAVSYSGVTAGNTTTVNIAVTCTSGSGQPVLWLISKNEEVFGFSAAQLTGTGNVTPVASFQTSAGSGYGITFDGSGNMWLAAGVTGGSPYVGHVYEYTPSQLTAANGSVMAPNVDISVISSTNAVGIYDLKFDNTGTLWVTTSSNDTIRGFTASQLTATGSPSPARVLTPQSLYLSHGLAFDAAGSLWVGTGLTDPSPYLSAGGALAVSLSVSGGTTQDSIVMDPIGGGQPYFMAFDASGNLWVTGGQDSIVAYTKSQIPSGTDKAPADPAIVITLPTGIAQPQGIAFDSNGNLWVICAEISTSANSALLRIPASQLTASGKATPDVNLTVSTDAESNFIGTPRGLVFAPGAGLPLNTNRVKRHR